MVLSTDFVDVEAKTLTKNFGMVQVWLHQSRSSSLGLGVEHQVQTWLRESGSSSVDVGWVPQGSGSGSASPLRLCRRRRGIWRESSLITKVFFFSFLCVNQRTFVANHCLATTVDQDSRNTSSDTVTVFFIS